LRPQTPSQNGEVEITILAATVTYQTHNKHNRAGAPGAAVPALQAKYESVRQRGQVTKVAIGSPILLPLPEWE
jgi:hypothetical protein